MVAPRFFIKFLKVYHGSLFLSTLFLTKVSEEEKFREKNLEGFFLFRYGTRKITRFAKFPQSSSLLHFPSILPYRPKKVKQ